MATSARSWMNDVPVLGTLKRQVGRLVGRDRFAGSTSYWESRYQHGGHSGAGSYGQLAEFKAEIVNGVVAERGISSILELGCGDGAQLELAIYPQYTGVDVAHTSIEICRRRFDHDPTKTFVHLDDLIRVHPHEMALSLDVVYHLVEDQVFEAHMRALFANATRLVVIYASNQDAPHNDPHVRHREFTAWISLNESGWQLTEHLPNRYPAAPGDETNETSFADFYIFERRDGDSAAQ